jgi:hypothetical protein
MELSCSLESEARIAPIPRDQRTPAYFPIERELRFRTIGKRDEMAGSGKTIDIGSKRVVFRTNQTLQTGKRIDMAISWPVQLNQHCALKLIASGKIVRAESGVVAISIEHYEFRTLGVNGLAI